jgi:hypothetical protein
VSFEQTGIPTARGTPVDPSFDRMIGLAVDRTPATKAIAMPERAIRASELSIGP